MKLGGIKEEVENKLRKSQESKEFKDAGARVGGSKKERAAYASLIKVSDLSNLEKDSATATEMIVKDKVYPKVIAENEKAKGVSSGAAYLKTELRSAFPSQPKKPTIEHRRAYVGFIESFIQSLDQCYNVEHISVWSEKYYKLSASEFLEITQWPDLLNEKNTELLNKRFPAYHIRGILIELFGSTFYNLLFKKSDAGIIKWNKARSVEELTTEEETKYLIARQIHFDELIQKEKRKIEEYKTASPANLEELKNQWSNYQPDSEKFRIDSIAFFEKKIQNLEEQKNIIPPDKKARTENWDWTGKERKKSENKTELRINSGIPLSYIKRIGGLKINTVTEQEIIDLFGFRAVEFGHYVKDIEAKEHVRHFLSACADLFEILNYNAIEINKKNNLSIAFGSRGSGSAMAAYYPLRKIINITKSRGDGTIAHEWAHYFDHMLYNINSKAKYGNEINSKDPLVTANPKSILNNNISLALQDLMNYIYKGDGSTKYIKIFFNASDGPTYSRYKGDSIEDSLSKVKLLSPSYLTIQVNSNCQKVQQAVLGYLAKIHSLPFIEVELSFKQYSNFYMYSSRMQSNYWIKPWELFARGFETYIYDKLIKQSRCNNYLVSGGEFDNPLKVYPFGKEREDLFALYDNFMYTVKKELSISDFTLFTTIRTDEYIQFDEEKEEEKIKKGVVIAQKNISPLLTLEAKLLKLTMSWN